MNTNKKFSAFFVCNLRSTFQWNKDGTPRNFEIKNRPRTQEADWWYEENGAIYGTSSKNFQRYRSLQSEKTGFVVMSKIKSVDIDYEDDLVMAAALMSTRCK